MNITKTAVDRLTTGFIWDGEIKGFGCRSEGKGKFYMRIPIEAGRVFRREAGRGSDLKPATVPK